VTVIARRRRLAAFSHPIRSQTGTSSSCSRQCSRASVVLVVLTAAAAAWWSTADRMAGLDSGLGSSRGMLGCDA